LNWLQPSLTRIMKHFLRVYIGPSAALAGLRGDTERGYQIFQQPEADHRTRFEMEGGLWTWNLPDLNADTNYEEAIPLLESACKFFGQKAHKIQSTARILPHSCLFLPSGQSGKMLEHCCFCRPT
jgi:hypothetical protein